MPKVFINAFVYTGNKNHDCIADGVVLVSGSEISWVGTASEWESGQSGAASLSGGHNVEVTDLRGSVLIPGFINGHTHGGLGAFRGVCDDGDFAEWALALAPHTAHVTTEDSRLGCYLTVLEMVRHGITTACDCTRYDTAVFSEVASRVGIRSLSGALANSPSLRKAGRSNWPGAIDETLSAMEARSGDGLSQFYFGAHSPYNCTPELIVEVKQQARKHNLPFVIHAAEMKSEIDTVRDLYGKTPVEHLYDLGVLDSSTIMAHGVWLSERDIELIASTGASVIHNPISNAKLGSGIAPVPELLEAGVKVGLGTDSMLSNNTQSIMQEMKTAIMLQRASRITGHALNSGDTLRMANLGGAAALGLDRQIGSIEAGKRADLVILDIYHPLGHTRERVMSDLVYYASAANVKSVVVGGRFIYKDGQFCLIDEKEVRESVRRHYTRP